MLNQGVVLCSLLVSVISAPIQMVLNPMEQQFMEQEIIKEIESLQEVKLQRLKAMQMLYQMPMNMNSPQPIMPIVLIPVDNMKAVIEKQDGQHNLFRKTPGSIEKFEKYENYHRDDDEDSIVIDAEPIATETQQRKVILLAPTMNQGRFSIGQIIGSIPWLPIEVNVPDTISWIWNGIGSIIGGIGQANPFRPSSQQMTSTTPTQASTKLLPNIRNPIIDSTMPMPIVFLPMQYGPVKQP